MALQRKHIYGVLGVFFLSLMGLYNNCGTGVGNVEFFNAKKKKVPQATQKLAFGELNEDATDNTPPLTTSSSTTSTEVEAAQLTASLKLNASEVEGLEEAELTSFEACISDLILYDASLRKKIINVNKRITISKDGSISDVVEITTDLGLKIKSAAMLVSQNCDNEEKEDESVNFAEDAPNSFVLNGTVKGADTEPDVNYTYQVKDEMAFVFIGDYTFGYEEFIKFSFAEMSEKFREDLANLDPDKITTIVNETEGEVKPWGVFLEHELTGNIQEWRNGDTYPWLPYEEVIAYVVGVGINVHNNTDKDLTDEDQVRYKINGLDMFGGFCGGAGIVDPLKIPAGGSYMRDMYRTWLSLGGNCKTSPSAIIMYCLTTDSDPINPVYSKCEYRTVDLIPTAVIY
jgi:hypothetical protein